MLALAATSNQATRFLNKEGIVNAHLNMMQSTLYQNLDWIDEFPDGEFFPIYETSENPMSGAAVASLWNRLLPTGSTFTTYSFFAGWHVSVPTRIPNRVGRQKTGCQPYDIYW
jgi:hypothetical protein